MLCKLGQKFGHCKVIWIQRLKALPPLVKESKGEDLEIPFLEVVVLLLLRRRQRSSPLIKKEIASSL